MELYELFLQCITIPYKKVGASANYAIKRKQNTLYIFFEDSDGINDWKINLNFPVKPYSKMCDKVWFAHRGFLKVWKEIEPEIQGDISDKSVEEIIITGYSHGAAIALLCHEYVWYCRPDLRKSIRGYGFGCPRVFWGIAAKALMCRWENFLVIRNIDDIVTHLPPAIFGYRHVGAILEIGKKGKYSPFSAHLAENILKELKIYEEKSEKPLEIKNRITQKRDTFCFENVSF